MARLSPCDTAEAALAVMEGSGIGAVAVCEDGVLVGILTERDVIRNWRILLDRPQEATVGDLMTPDPVTIRSSDSIAAALQRMRQSGHRHLPVMRAGRVVGILSAGDIPAGDRLKFERFAEFRAGSVPPPRAAAG